MLNISSAFSASNGMTMHFFFDFDYVVDYIDGCLYIESSLHRWDEAYLILVVNDHYDAFSDSLTRHLLNIFASIFIRIIGLQFSLFVGSLCGFVSAKL